MQNQRKNQFNSEEIAMKNKKYAIKGTPIIPSLCGIGMAVLWYVFFYVSAGKWTFDFNSFSFAEMNGVQLSYTILTLVVPILYFVAVLFLAELDVRWMTGAILFPIALQMFLFIFYLTQESPEYIFENPINFLTPFLALILYVLTVEKIIPTKWVFVGFCGLAILLPLVLTLCGVGEFTITQQGYSDTYQPITIVTRLWSDYLSFALYYLGLGTLVLKMRNPADLIPAPFESPAEDGSEESAVEVAEESEESAEEPEESAEEPEEK